MQKLDIRKRYSDTTLREFADYVKEISARIGFKVSSRGWCYQLEQAGYITKDNFDKVTTLINNCRKKGFLPVDFVAEDSPREFKNIVTPDKDIDFESFLTDRLESVFDLGHHYTPDYWKGEKYYIQIVVEKTDLVTLFLPVCEKYKIPIANSKGWSSVLQRAQYARRYAEAQANGNKCVLLYCGDHDPDGLRISDFLRKNLADLKNVVWGDGMEGYDPADLIIERFGLNYDLIQRNNLTWIDNLITGSGKNLADPEHKNNKMPYVQTYLKDIGERKCEANAIVPMPDVARELCEKSITKYLGLDAEDRFYEKDQKIIQDYREYLDNLGISGDVQDIIDRI